MNKTTLDTRGLLCPLPVLKARKALRSLSQGDILIVISDDPAARIDIPHFCNEIGYTLQSQDDLGDGSYQFRIEKV